MKFSDTRLGNISSVNFVDQLKIGDGQNWTSEVNDQ